MDFFSFLFFSFLFFSYRCDYCLIEGKDGIDVGDGMVDLDFENLVHS